MKRYVITPRHKKSTIELQYWKKDIDGVPVTVTYEECWRWGSFILDVPETQEEVDQWLEDEVGYNTIGECFEDYGVESIEEILLPSLDEDIVLLTEDYGTYFELVETWDGCGSDFRAYSPDLSAERLEEIEEEFAEGWCEGHYEWAEGEGWVEQGCDYEIHSGFEMKEFNGDYSEI
jgi:hypothetical protein